MIINHNCCIKLVPLVIFIYNARSHIYQIFSIFEAFIFLFSQPQSVSFSQLSVFFLYKISQNAIRVQPGVHVNYMNVIFTGNLGDTRQRRAGAALWPPLLCTDKVQTWLQIVRLLFVHISFNDAVPIADIIHSLKLQRRYLWIYGLLGSNNSARLCTSWYYITFWSRKFTFKF